ncbi:MAG: lectin-like protein [Trichodesmium sp. MO_231.B1]|nr:lectin-like protein [Trichodesmium sp. MO_231.B1]
MSVHQLSIVGIAAMGLTLGTVSAAKAFTITNPANGHQYFQTTPDTWTGAQAQAVAAGGNLVTINNAEEQAWLISIFGSKSPFWIGLNDIEVEGQFKWASGQPITYTNWLPSEPNNFPHIPEGEDFVQMFGDTGRWVDTTTYLINLPPNFSPGIVEIETPPESVPEPSTLITLLVFGGLGVRSLLLRKSQ